MNIPDTLSPHRLLFLISSKGSFICTIPQTGLPHITAFATPVEEHWVERDRLTEENTDCSPTWCWARFFHWYMSYTLAEELRGLWLSEDDPTRSMVDVCVMGGVRLDTRGRWMSEEVAGAETKNEENYEN